MDQDYKFYIIESKPEVAVIKMRSQALGGNDALDFTSKIQTLSTMPIKAVVADLSELGVINSSGLGMLVAGLSTLRKFKISFILAHVPEKVDSLLQVTHLNKVFSICPTIDAAVESLNK